MKKLTACAGAVFGTIILLSLISRIVPHGQYGYFSDAPSQSPVQPPAGLGTAAESLAAVDDAPDSTIPQYQEIVTSLTQKYSDADDTRVRNIVANVYTLLRKHGKTEADRNMTCFHILQDLDDMPTRDWPKDTLVNKVTAYTRGTVGG